MTGIKTAEMNAKLVTDKDYIREFGIAMQGAAEGWRMAGKIDQHFKSQTPRAKELLVLDYPGLDGPSLDRLEDIARGSLLPKLAMSNCPGFIALRRLSLED